MTNDRRVVVQFLVEPEREIAVAAATSAVLGSATGDRRPADVGHDGGSGASLRSLHAAFPYTCCVVLVVEWPLLLAELSIETLSRVGFTSPIDARRIMECLAGWDGVLVVSDATDIAFMSAVLSSRLAPRLGLALFDEVGSTRWARELERVAAAASVLPPARPVVSAELQLAISRLPVTWQPTVHEALRNRDAWTVKRLSAECGVGRRTIERWFRKAGLVSPSVLLRVR
ncbi:MAG: hypothetical protein MUD17_07650 [Gemmatimonadaceae bacterium]|jgi:hypothetical protein|nr:hypothetical protein [Gemmatimonadaceae bacterium]